MVFNSMVNKAVFAVSKLSIRRYFQKIALSFAAVATVFIMSSQSAWAYFDFINKLKRTDLIDLSLQKEANISFSFPIELTAKDGDKNSTQGTAYRLAISDHIIQGGSNVSEPVDPGAASISPYITAIKVDNAGTWDVGKWSPSGTLRTSSANKEIKNIVLTLSRDKLVEIAENSSDIIFYLTGVSSDNTYWLDQIEVRIPVINPAQMNISGLKDIKLPGPETTANKYLKKQLKFCVYATHSPYEYKIKFTGKNQPMAPDFALQMHGSKTVNKIPYNIDFKTTSTSKWTSVPVSNQYLSSRFTASSDLNCGGNTNAAIKISVARNATLAVPSGKYQDTLEITVEPS